MLAALAGAPLVLGAAGGVLVAAAAIALAGRDERLGGDIGVAVAVSALFGLGALLALSPEAPPRLQELLFGDLLGADGGRPRGRGRRSRPLIAVALALAHRRLSASGFDRAAARSLGAAPARWELALLVLLAVATMAAAPGAREPAAGGADRRAGRGRRCGSPAACPPRSPWPPRSAALAGVAGLVLSFHLGIAAGASVALCAALLAGAAQLRPG